MAKFVTNKIILSFQLKIGTFFAQKAMTRSRIILSSQKNHYITCESWSMQLVLVAGQNFKLIVFMLYINRSISASSQLGLLINKTKILQFQIFISKIILRKSSYGSKSAHVTNVFTANTNKRTLKEHVNIHFGKLAFSGIQLALNRFNCRSAGIL